jgi:histidine ammonia-lyase
MDAIEIGARPLDLPTVATAAAGGARLALGEAARARVIRAHRTVGEVLASGRAVYGVNTGFGKLAHVRIEPARIAELQRNLLRSHAAGMGPPLPPEETRLSLFLRIHTLALGHSGVSIELLERLVRLYNEGVLPVIPEQGSVGASGDLAPFAHLALVLLGEGEAVRGGVRRSGAAVLAELGLEPYAPAPKEGLALINGTGITAAIGLRVALRARAFLRAADAVGALSVEASRGSPSPFHERVAAARPHPGHAAAAANVRRLLEGSAIVESHRDCAKVQDPYSFRCLPQIHGAVRDALAHVEEVLLREANSATDNPLVFAEEGALVSAGNFHAQAAALALDYLAAALAVFAAAAERRVDGLMNAEVTGLPAFLTRESGLRSGFMMAQVTAASLVGEARVLAHPASPGTVPTGGGQEDHVSHGPFAARKAGQVLALAEKVLAIELLAAAQGIDLLRPLRTTPGLEAAHAALRARVPRLDEDRVLAPDLEAAHALVRDGDLLRTIEDTVGPLE